MTNFSSLELSESMLHNLNELGYKDMTLVQQQSLPDILKGQDVIVKAKTGSGKTVAFGIGVLSKLNVKKFRPQSLILCPTRELADQVANELRRLARFTHNIKILTLCGGVPFGPQLGSLQHEAHIIVGTPGRVLKHIAKGSLSINDLDTLVLDEADRMLDMGFSDEINQIIFNMPTKRQTLLFSATYSDEILGLSTSIQKEATHIETTSNESANKVAEYFYDVSPDDKFSTLIKILSEHKPENAIIFSNTKQDTKEICSQLQQKGISTLAIHGDLEQYQRNDALIRFANQSCAILVATDVAARGLDIKDLDMVINYELPYDETTYIHRIGRTARAGKEGKSFTIVAGRDAIKADDYRNDNRIFAAASALIGDAQFKLKAPNVTLVIEAGKKDKVRPGDILGALSGDAGIESKFVGKINVNDRQSYVAIESSKIGEACSRLKNGKIKGRKFSVWILK